MRKAKKIERKLQTDLGGYKALNGRAFDHCRYEGDHFISEPYNVGFEDLKKLIKKCEENGLTFFIAGDSKWNPPSTIRIVFDEVKQ